MKKILNIAWKDLLLMANDPGALLLTIITPFALTLVMIFAFGGVNDSGISGIQVAVVNLDNGLLGESLVDVFTSEELADLVITTEMQAPGTAREAVDDDQFAAAVIIPPDFSDQIVPASFTNEKNQDLDQPFDQNDLQTWNADREPATIEIYANPTKPTSVSVVQSIVDEFINRSTAVFASTQVTIVQLIKNGLLNPDATKSAFISIGELTAEKSAVERRISLTSSTSEVSAQADFDWFGYIAPSMALLFLMFTVSNGGRSILIERESGTLPRMLVSPSNAAQVLGGKVFSIYINGVLQLSVLFIASLLLLQINWGAPQVVIPTILLVVAAATGWGMLIAAFSKTPAQASILGTAITLLFAIGSGSFFPRQFLPIWLQKASLISPNAWGIEAFNSIRLGAAPVEMLPLWTGMISMFGILFVISVIVFRKQYQ